MVCQQSSTLNKSQMFQWSHWLWWAQALSSATIMGGGFLSELVQSFMFPSRKSKNFSNPLISSLTTIKLTFQFTKIFGLYPIPYRTNALPKSLSCFKSAKLEWITPQPEVVNFTPAKHQHRNAVIVSTLAQQPVLIVVSFLVTLLFTLIILSAMIHTRLYELLTLCFWCRLSQQQDSPGFMWGDQVWAPS